MTKETTLNVYEQPVTQNARAYTVITTDAESLASPFTTLPASSLSTTDHTESKVQKSHKDHDHKDHIDRGFDNSLINLAIAHLVGNAQCKELFSKVQTYQAWAKDYPDLAANNQNTGIDLVATNHITSNNDVSIGGGYRLFTSGLLQFNHLTAHFRAFITCLRGPNLYCN